MVWASWLVAAAAVAVVGWALLFLLGRRLPPGLLRDMAASVPACVTTAWRLRADPRVPRRVKVVIVFAVLWVVSPIDLIPEFVPVVGPFDDIVVVALCLRYVARRVPRVVLQEAWPAEQRMLDRLVAPRRPAPRHAPPDPTI